MLRCKCFHWLSSR